MFNRTHLERGTMHLDPKKYTTPPHVRFNQEKMAQGSSFNPKYFNCHSNSSEGKTFSSLLMGFFVLSLAFLGVEWGF
jgi:hypothetical protein